MARESEFDDNLRLAILKYELQSEYHSSVATYAIARWPTSAQRLLSQLFSEPIAGEWNEAYIKELISRFKPNDTLQLEPLCKIAVSTERHNELRLASLDAIQSAILNPTLASSVAQVIPYLMQIIANPMETDELRRVAIEAIASLKVDAKEVVPTLMDLFAQSELPEEVRAATANALAKLSPESTEAASAIAFFMGGLQTEDSLFANLATNLGEFGSIGAVGIDRLVEGLHSEEELTRQNCVQSLGKIGQSASRVASSLVLRILDRNETIAVKSFAAKAIQRMGSDSVQLLSEQIRNPDAIIQEHVLRALSQAAETNPSFLAPFLSIVLDTNEEELVRAAAASVKMPLLPFRLYQRVAIPLSLVRCERPRSSH